DRGTSTGAGASPSTGGPGGKTGKPGGGGLGGPTGAWAALTLVPTINAVTTNQPPRNMPYLPGLPPPPQAPPQTSPGAPRRTLPAARLGGGRPPYENRPRLRKPNGDWLRPRKVGTMEHGKNRGRPERGSFFTRSRSPCSMSARPVTPSCSCSPSSGPCSPA